MIPTPASTVSFRRPLMPRGRAVRVREAMSDDAAAFPTLGPADLDFLSTLAERRPVAAGELLFRSGEPTTHFYVVLSGLIELFVDVDGSEEVIRAQGPGMFTGELNVLTGMRLLASARVVEGGEVLVVPRDSLRR